MSPRARSNDILTPPPNAHAGAYRGATCRILIVEPRGTTLCATTHIQATNAAVNRVANRLSDRRQDAVCRPTHFVVSNSLKCAYSILRFHYARSAPALRQRSGRL